MDNAETFNNLERLKAKGQFEINDGFLPKLGNTEFMVKKFNMSKKVKISSLTNADLTSADTFRSDINGSLILDNYKLEDIEMTTRHKSFATLLQGSYNIRGQEADINIYGKYDRQAPKGVKILFLPLNWIINFALRNDESKAFYQKELNKIPSIECLDKDKNERYFKINLKGNLNTEQIKVDIKALQ